nr:hypothetical protein [Mycoplasmopsis bovis]
MTYLPNKVNENIFRSIYYEDDLDKLAGYYKLSENLIGDDSYVVDDLWKNFKEDKEIYSFDKLWDRIDNELREHGINANLYSSKRLITNG